MTDEEFQRLKEAEKEHLRAKKRLLARLAALKKRRQSQSLVQRMTSGAERLLKETEALVHSLRETVAKREARVELVLDEDGDEDLREADEALREERAEQLLRQYKAGQSEGETFADRAASEEEGTPDSGDVQKGPEKTIGRMRPPDSDEEEAK